MTWTWTGIRYDSKGIRRRTGFEWIISRRFNIRVVYFPVPAKHFDRMIRRVIVNVGRFSAMFNWYPKE